MLRQLLVGGAVSLVNIAIHAVVMATVVGTAHRALKWGRRRPQVWLAAVMVTIVGVLLVAHVAEVLTWSLAYGTLEVVPPGADTLYFAFVNYTTLGYGDVVPTERWRLLGPMAAMNASETHASKIDLEKFRLRTFVDRLIDMGEVEIHDEPVPLTGVGAIIERTEKAVLFKSAGPEKAEMVAKTAASRKRLIAAFETTEEKIYDEYFKRLANPKPVVEIPSGDAPVHASRAPAVHPCRLQPRV